MKKLTKIIGIAFLAVSVLSCSDDNESQPTIVDIASGDAEFSTLVRALERTDLVEILDGSGQFTVFAPTNAAFNTFFASLGAGVTVENVDAVVLKKILLNHVIGEEIKSGALPATTYASTLSPFNTSVNAPTISMFVQKSGSVVTINGGVDSKGAVVTTADLDASNGVIHVVNRVIQIPTLVDHVVDNPEFDTLQAVVTSESGGDFGDQSAVLNFLVDLTAGAPATLFAPNNAAFTSLEAELSAASLFPNSEQISSVLTYHVVDENNRSSDLPGIVSGNGIVPTFNLQSITFSLVGGAYKIIGTFTPTRPASTIIQSLDIQGSNGVIHTIDKVLLPTL